MADSPLAPHASTPAELQERLQAEKEGDPFLVLRDDQGRQRLEQLESRAGRVTIGRNPSNDVALTWDEEVSRLHAEIEPLGGEWILTDEGLSRNGSFVNGERVGGRSRLRDGDMLRFGQTMVLFRAPALTEATSTVVASDALSAAAVSPAQRRVLVALCRPFKDGAAFATPPTNQQLAEELHLSVDAVKTHMRALFEKFDVQELPQNRKRVAVVERALQTGLITPREL